MRRVLTGLLIAVTTTTGALADDDAARQRKMDLQERCADQARKEFKASGFDEINQLDTFQSHYSPTLERCLIVIESTKLLSVNKFVEDAFERRLFGQYSWYGREGKKYWEIPPVKCEFELPGAPKKTCQSAEEFDAYVQTLMDR